MSRAHDRYEALAGAILLGEATVAELEAFEGHAERCAQCAADLLGLRPLRETIEKAGATEVWRPSISGDVLERAHATSARRRHRVLTTFGYAIAASLVLNVAFVSGFAGRALDALRVASEYTYSPVGSITLERRPPAIAAAREELRSKPASRALKTQALAHADRLHASKAPPKDDVAEILGGLAIWGNESGSRSVASTFDARCVERTATTAVVPQPCRSPNP